MADLTRLASIALNVDSPAATLAAVVYYTGKVTPGAEYVEPAVLRDVLGWIAASPMLSIGNVVNEEAVAYVRLYNGSDKLNNSVLDDASYYLRHFGPLGGSYTKDARTVRVAEIINHASIHQGEATTGPVETALLESVSVAGYEGLAGALGAVSRLHLQQVIDKPDVVVTQLDRAVFTASTVAREATGEHRFLATPPCVSRQSAIACLAVMLSVTHRRLVTDRIREKATTVTSMAARIDLEAVRDIVYPARELITNYIFDPAELVLRDQNGRVRERATSRSPAAIVAFAFLTSRGSSDVLMDLANRRVDAVVDKDSLVPHVQEYYDNSRTIYSSLLLFLRALEGTRWERANNGRGEDVNKGPCLGYMAAGRTRRDRNTAAAVNRLSEMVVENRELVPEAGRILYILDWNGVYDRSVVLGAASLMKIDVALDMGASGHDVGGVANPDKASQTRHYTVLLPALPGRSMPTCSTVEYQPGDGTASRIRILVDAIGGFNDAYSYIYGGTPADKTITPAVSVDEAQARVFAVSGSSVGIPNALSTVDILLPPSCYHWPATPVDTMVDTFGDVDESCMSCQDSVRALRRTAELLSVVGARLVKTRSAFGHNAQFDIEVSPAIRDGASDTGVTLDATAMLNHMRNKDWGGDTFRPGGVVASTNQYTAEVDEECHAILTHIRMLTYEDLAGIGEAAGPLPSSDFDDVARSLG
ncbi:hypothetical protein KM557_s4gp1 [Penicillium brevicompactum tetramycovirus 1]|uniref:Uncharacterized protein n=1 Tax=Penicillium brevicompactum tetramycovirus 1 TaxID=2485923 RepID=A0A3G3C4M9_9VIRU|nr:hypothetical protein KM557_s4gp1 [Penicillium brevicompactum tetramycovirus 1]AYP71804.1 hypothetical protein [Penicillium brevicompactum tetramycovirus 1]